MATKTIKVLDVTHVPGQKRVILFSNGHRYITAAKVLSMKGVKNPFTLRGKNITISTYEVGEALVNGTPYDQREDSTLVKELIALPELSLNEMIASEVGAQMATMLLAGMGAAPAAAPAPAAPAENAGAMAADAANDLAALAAEDAANAAAPANPGAEQVVAPAVPAPAAVLDENLPA